MRLHRRASIVRAVWLSLPPLARWALLGLGRRPATVTMGDLRRIREGL